MFYENIVKFLKELNLEGRATLPKELSLFSFFAEGVTVNLTDKAPGMELTCNLGEIQTEKPLEEVYSKLLMGNFLGLATKKACLGLDETGKNLLVQASIQSVRSYREFRDTVEDFVNTITFWKKELSLK